MTAATLAAQAPAQPAYSDGYRRWFLFLLVLTYTLNFVDRTIVAVLAQPIKEALNLSDTQIGLLGGLAFALVYTLLGVFMARLAERYSRVVIMTVAIAIWSAMTALGGLVSNFWQLAFARAGVGVGEAGFLPTSHSLISDHFPPSRRATALAIFALGIPLGSLTGAFAGGWIAEHLSWRSAFFVVGAPGLLVALLVLFTFKEPPRGMNDSEAVGETPSTLAVLRRMASKPAMLWAIAGATCASTGGYGVGNFLGPHLIRHFHLTLSQAGVVGGLIVGAPPCIGALFGGVIADWVGKRDKRGYGWVPAAGLLFAAPFYMAGLMQPGWQVFFALMLIAGVGQQFYLGPTFGVVNNAMHPQMRATAVAFMSVCLNLIGLGLGPLLTGRISDGFARSLGQGTGADLLNLCAATANGACNASATGLQYAMIIMTGFYVLGALCFLMATRSLRRDLA
jgi:predicted MFS family arabinose efflux permease